tara:strand:+ start:503 stop:718 length:216 start_codon:yes stop_codon:yes gene_type:complete
MELIEKLEDPKLVDKTAMELATTNGELKFLRNLLRELNASEHAQKTIDLSIERVNKVIGFILDNRKLELSK